MVKQHDLVRIGAVGSIYVADLKENGKPELEPATLAANWNESVWTEVGHISEDGIVEGYEDDSEEIKDMSGTTVRAIITGTKATLKFSAMESNLEVYKLFYKTDDIDEDKDGTIHAAIKTPEPKQMSFGVDVLDGKKLTRLYLPFAEVTERAEVTHKSGEPTLYEFTITAFTDEFGTLIYKQMGDLKKVLEEIQLTGIIRSYGMECLPSFKDNVLTVEEGLIFIKANNKVRRMISPKLVKTIHQQPNKGAPRTSIKEYAYLSTNDIPRIELVTDKKVIDTKDHILLCSYTIDGDKVSNFKDMRHFYKDQGLDNIKKKLDEIDDKEKVGA